MLPQISLFSSIGLILLTFFTIFLVTVVILPMRKVNSYKQEGVATFFYPILGFLKYWGKNRRTKGDIMAGAKEAFKKNPNQRFIVSNLNKKIFFILHDPKYIKEFLQNPQLYHKSQIVDWLRVFIGNGLVVAEGDTWKRHRKIISNSFHYEFLKSNLDLIQGTTREFLDKTTTEEYKAYSAIEKVQEITGEIVGRIFFGENLNSYTLEGKSLCLVLADITSELAFCGRTPLVIFFGIKFLRFPLIPRFKKIVTRVDNFRKMCFKIIEDRKAKPQQGNDLLGLLLATQKSDDPEKRFSDEEIVNEFLTFFIAGMDTTGHLIGMTLYILSQYPQYLTDLKEERDRLYNKEGKTTTEEIQKMDILHSLLKETLRFYTPAPITFARVALADHQLLDISVKKGDLVMPELLASAFDERNFENPEKFNPERWRTSDSKTDPYAFVPFSAGPRNCIGQHLAIIESKVIISEFLNRFDFKLIEGYQLRMAFKFLYEPEEPLVLELSPKKV